MTKKCRRTKKDTKLPQTSVPQDLRTDEAVHKEGSDSVERGMDTGGSPRRQDTMGGTPAQTRFERVLEQPIKPPLSEGHTSGSREGRMEHQFELMANVPITPHDSPLPGGYTPDIASVLQLWKWKLHENYGVHTLFMDGTTMEINMLIEKKYLLIKELLEKMLNLQLEAVKESTMALLRLKQVHQSMLKSRKSFIDTPPNDQDAYTEET
ncbi:hypothetical protein Tco_0625674 [Tanacetum coccineum]|uniref:Uncharacterized protein n=1 Tax=Tanacetum coccineum TaxID=301880 RepID=A0ABQ4WHJ3_9ASTR